MGTGVDSRHRGCYGADMSSLKQAIDLLAAGDWQAAHAIVQKDGSTHGAWAHGIVHLMEGDRRNAGYWYGRTGRPLPSADAVATEIDALRAAALGGESTG